MGLKMVFKEGLLTAFTALTFLFLRLKSTSLGNHVFRCLSLRLHSEQKLKYVSVF